jgi:hypothetical protein
MDGETKPISLVDVYLALKQAMTIEATLETVGADLALDAIYRRIVAEPVRDIRGAVEKLRFASHCLEEEFDMKEAANLIEEVAIAFEKLRGEKAQD